MSIVIKNNHQIIMGKGKEFSEVAVESEGQLKSWLDASGIDEEDLIQDLDSGAFQLTLNKEKNGARIYLHRGADLIAQPLVWGKDSGVLFSHFKVEAGLLLMLVASKCSKKQAKDEIKKFIKGNLRVK